MEKEKGDTFHDEFHQIELRQLLNELKQAPGDTAKEKVAGVLAHHGWDRRLDVLKDDRALYGLVMNGLKLMALPGRTEPSADEIEKLRRERALRKAVASGMYGDLFADQYCGLSLAELARSLPDEQYFVRSLGRLVPREELPLRLSDVPELRKASAAEVFRLEKEAMPRRHEMAIFDEMLRQAARSAAVHADGESVPS